MEIQCTDNKTFDLSDGAQKLGHISYDNLFTHNATAVVGNERYEINTVGIFSTNICVTINGLEVAIMQMSWRGHIIISLQNGGGFVLKTTGLFKSLYVLEEADHGQLMLLTPDFDWRKFNYNYTVSYDSKPKNILLVLLAVYCANYYIASLSAVY